MRFWQTRFALSDIGIGLVAVSYLLVVFSSPMPAKPGLIEVLMGIGLTAGTLSLAVTLLSEKTRELKILFLCAVYFLAAPFVTGIVLGNELSDMARDIAPLLYMTVLPLLIGYSQQKKNLKHQIGILLGVIMVVAVVTAVQFYHGILVLFGSMEIYLSKFSHVLIETENTTSWLGWLLGPLGLENLEYQTLMVKCQDPALLFAAIYLLSMGLSFILIKPRRGIAGLLALGGGGLSAYAFSALGLRAFSGLLVLSLGLFVMHLVRHKKFPLWALLGAGLVFLLVFYAPLATLFSQMWAKQQTAGLNGRPQEIIAVLESMSASVDSLLFGFGWGGLIANPIYDGASTRYTHSLFTYWLLKTGLVGCSVMAFFVITLIRQLDLRGLWISSHRFAIFLGAMSVILIAVLFEPTYKMLSFGIVLGVFLAVFIRTPLVTARGGGSDGPRQGDEIGMGN